MKYFTPMLLVLSILSTTAIAQNTEFISRGKAFNGPDRTITWRPWQQSPENDTSGALFGNTTWDLSKTAALLKRSNYP